MLLRTDWHEHELLYTAVLSSMCIHKLSSLATCLQVDLAFAWQSMLHPLQSISIVPVVLPGNCLAPCGCSIVQSTSSWCAAAGNNLIQPLPLP